MSIRRLFAFLIALSVLLAPGVASTAMAAAPHQDMTMMEAGHCNAPPANPGGHHEKMDGKSCCIWMCTAVAVAPVTPAADRLDQPDPPLFTLSALHRAYLGEIATPPPRIA